MKRWKRRRVEEVEAEPEEFEEDELEEEGLAPGYFEDEDPGMPEAKWNKLEAKIRAGKYTPKHADPWTLHVLYSNLRDLGEL